MRKRKERECEKEEERERVTGALAPFSYLVVNILFQTLQVTNHNWEPRHSS